MKSSILSGRQFLALHIFAPTATGLTFFDLAPGGRFDKSFALSQFQQESAVLYLFLELAHGFFHIAIRNNY